MLTEERGKSMNKILRTLLLITFFTSFLFINNTQASKKRSSGFLSVKKLERIIVLESGRKKPLETFARNKLLQFSGKQRIKGFSAIQWLSRVIFDPASADNDLIFLINNPEVADALSIKSRSKRRYCFAELFPAWEKIVDHSRKAYAKDPSNWSSFEKEMVQTYRNIEEYQSLRSVFSFLSPNPHFTISDSSLSARFGFKPDYVPSFFDLLSRSEIIVENMKAIQQKEINDLSHDEISVLRLAQNMFELEKSIDNPSPHIIPVIKDGIENWLSPWEYLKQFKSSSVKDKPVQMLIRIREAYLARNQALFDKSIDEYQKVISGYIRDKISIPDPGLELLYNKTNPFFWSKILYGLAALLSLLTAASITRKTFMASLCLIIPGFIFHTAAIIARMIIMSHPPVTNLYETFIFTAWASVLLGFILELMKVRSLGVLTASLTGFLFIHIAGKYALDGDTLGMLAAILDSSFWLTTHIVTISLGYAGCIGAGLLGHVYLIYQITKADNSRYEEQISRSIYGFVAFGFVFTIIGTIFGGLWADQAWGRFWGWDPKENGALLIILWCLIILHAKSGGFIKNTGMAVGSIITAVLVMCAWIGVNLLGIGLHAYGFTSLGAWYLISFILFELIFLSVTGFILVSQKNKSSLVQKST